MAFPDSDLQVQILAYLGADPTAAPGSWPAPVDLSSRLVDSSMRITRGRNAGQTTLSSASCTFDLNNVDGALTPLLATSPYYGDWDLGVPVAVDVTGVGASPPYGRCRGYVADITQTVVPGVGGANLSVVRVTLGGKARQITQGKVVKSAMRRYYDNVSPQPVAYWPLESGDQRGALSFLSALGGGSTLDVTQSTAFGVTRPFSAAGGVTPGPPGAASATDTHAGGFLVGRVPSVSTATTARGELSMLADGFENTFPVFVSLRHSGVASDGAESRIGAVSQLISGAWQVGVVWVGSAGASSLYAPASASPLLQDNEWHHLQLDISSANGGADTAFTLRVDGVNVVSGTATGYPWVPPTKVSANLLATDVDRIAHLAVWSGASLPTAADGYDAFLGHPGEAAHTRFARICTEDGISYSTSATSSHGLGPQPVGDTFAVLQDIEAGDHGVLYELANTWGFGFLSSRQRTNLAAAMTIDLSTYRTSDDGGSVLTPVRNDARIRNEWTVSTADGRAATAIDATNQSKRGVYDDSVDVNLSSTTDLASEAGWRVREGTYDGPRYRTMPIDLAANSASPSDLLTPWLATELGNRIDRTNNPVPEHPYGGTTLILEGYTETLARRSWKVDAVVEPYDPWRVMNAANASPDLSAFVGRAAGDPACAIRADITSGATSVDFDPNFFRWTTTAAHLNPANWPALQVQLNKARGIAGGGELVTASAISTTAATFVAAGATAHANNLGVTPALYAGDAQGDWIVVVARKGGAAGSLSISAGYTLLAQQGLLYVWARLRGSSSPGAPTITPSGGSLGDAVSAVTFGLRNMPITLSLDRYVLAAQKQSNASAQNIAYAGRTDPGIYPGAVQLLIAGKTASDTGIAPPSGYTEDVDATTATGNGQSLYVAHRIDTAPTQTPPDSLVVTGGVAAVSDSLLLTLAGGYQTMTVTRSANGVTKAHSAGTLVAVDHPLTQAL